MWKLFFLSSIFTHITKKSKIRKRSKRLENVKIKIDLWLRKTVKRLWVFDSMNNIFTIWIGLAVAGRVDGQKIFLSQISPKVNNLDIQSFILLRNKIQKLFLLGIEWNVHSSVRVGHVVVYCVYWIELASHFYRNSSFVESHTTEQLFWDWYTCNRSIMMPCHFLHSSSPHHMKMLQISFLKALPRLHIHFIIWRTKIYDIMSKSEWMPNEKRMSKTTMRWWEDVDVSHSHGLKIKKEINFYSVILWPP